MTLRYFKSHPRASTILLAASIASGIVMISGCAAMRSRQAMAGEIAVHKGAAYCLPMGKVKIKIERTISSTGIAETTTSTTTETASTTSNTTTTVTGGPAGLGAVVGTGAPAAGTTATYRISHVSTDYYPDQTKQFAVRYTPNAMADDNITVEVGKDSLLKSVDVKVKDMSVEASKKIFEIGRNLLKAYYRGTAALPFGSSGTSVIFEGSFDPVNGRDLAEVNEALRNVEGGPYRVVVIGKSSRSYKAVTSSYKAPDVDGSFSGVAYRPALAYDLRLERFSANKWVPDQIATVALPNEAEVLYFPLGRSAFVERTTKLTFDQGMLTKVELSKPSEINSALDIPLELSRTLAALPGEMVAASVDGMKTRRMLHDEHIDFARKELEYENSLRDLQQKAGAGDTEAAKPSNKPVNTPPAAPKTGNPPQAAKKPADQNPTASTSSDGNLAASAGDVAPLPPLPANP